MTTLFLAGVPTEITGNPDVMFAEAHRLVTEREHLMPKTGLLPAPHWALRQLHLQRVNPVADPALPPACPSVVTPQ